MSVPLKSVEKEQQLDKLRVLIADTRQILALEEEGCRIWQEAGDKWTKMAKSVAKEINDAEKIAAGLKIRYEAAEVESLISATKLAGFPESERKDSSLRAYYKKRNDDAQVALHEVSSAYHTATSKVYTVDQITRENTYNRNQREAERNRVNHEATVKDLKKHLEKHLGEMNLFEAELKKASLDAKAEELKAKEERQAAAKTEELKVKEEQQAKEREKEIEAGNVRSAALADSSLRPPARPADSPLRAALSTEEGAGRPTLPPVAGASEGAGSLTPPPVPVTIPARTTASSKEREQKGREEAEEERRQADRLEDRIKARRIQAQAAEFMRQKEREEKKREDAEKAKKQSQLEVALPVYR